MRKPNRKERKAKKSGSEVSVETDLLRCFLEDGQEEILLHPLVESFLQLKWIRLRKFFVLSFLMQMVLVLCYSSFILELYKVRCPFTSSMRRSVVSNVTSELNIMDHTMLSEILAEIQNFDNSTDSNFSVGLGITETTVERDLVPEDLPPDCRIRSYTSWGIVITLATFTLFKEIIQMIQCPSAYLRNLENWALILFLITISMSVVSPNTLIEWGLLHLLRYQYPIAAVGVCLAWGLLFIQIGKFPSVGLYVQMLVKVGSNFLTFLLVYGCILIAFAMSFSLLFPQTKSFGSFFEILLKLIRVMTGDVNVEYLLYDDPSLIPMYPSRTMANVIHTICVVILSVILMNLLVGLAVNDIQGLYRAAKLNKLARQAELIAYLESFILSKRFLYFLPSSVRILLLKSITVSPSYYKCFFYFHPNDKEDKRLPEDVKSSIIQLKEQCSHEEKNSTQGNNDNRNFKLETQIARLEAKIEQLLLINKATSVSNLVQE